jgi:hypothetical protein
MACRGGERWRGIAYARRPSDIESVRSHWSANPRRPTGERPPSRGARASPRPRRSRERCHPSGAPTRPGHRGPKLPRCRSRAWGPSTAWARDLAAIPTVPRRHAARPPMERPVSGREQALRWCEGQARDRGGTVWASQATGRSYWGRDFSHVWRRAMDAERRRPPRPQVDTLTRRGVP